ncbi:Leu/Phe/Val dehydrogenase [Aeribacillus pallidus]|uniref:Leu/Phe/Val dehydrogenase n=1 Tax=Aeribacillus pallidus TaxID=33936 RepID=UPI001F0753E7|nr:amino acid dehydrogenase [Aeribacillus pallidus]
MVRKNKSKSFEVSMKGIFELMKKYGHEQIVFNYDKATGLKAVIAIHDTTLGPAIGGLRMWKYNEEQEVIEDALHLSQGMTYKYAVHGFPYGGGKAAIWGDPYTEKNDELLQAFGTFVETLKGRFVVGTDVGISSTDLVSVRKQTKYVIGLPEEFGGVGSTAVITAFGVYQGMKASAKEVFGSDSLKGKTIAVQGLGKVGKELVHFLCQGEAKLIATDIFAESLTFVRENYPQVDIIEPDEIYSVDCDIFSPCALGGVLNDETIPQLKCKVVCGAANNVLKEMRHAEMLKERGILYAPDYVVNGGGLIQGLGELEGYNQDWAINKTAQIYDTLLRIYQISKEEKITTVEAANRLVEKRLQIIQQIKSKY